MPTLWVSTLWASYSPRQVKFPKEKRERVTKAPRSGRAMPLDGDADADAYADADVDGAAVGDPSTLAPEETSVFTTGNLLYGIAMPRAAKY